MMLYSAWRSTFLSTRIKIAEKFGIAKIGPTHVRDNYIESDGYKIEDVERALNIDAIQEFLGSKETDMAVIFQELVDKIEAPEVPQENVPVEAVAPQATEEVITEAPKKRGRKPKAK